MPSLEAPDRLPLHAYVVLAHRAPRQVLRLVERLTGEYSWVFVHVDARAAAPVFEEIAEGLVGHERAMMVDRTPVVWGGWGIVEAMHIGLRSALAAKPRFNHVIMASGQDYPIQSRQAITDFLGDHPGCSFISHVPLPSQYYGKHGGINRVMRWNTPMLGRHVSVPLIPRTFPAALRPLVGSAWFCLSREAAEGAVAFSREHPRTVRYFRHVWAPDEHYMQSVVTSLPLSGPVYNETLWHMEWTTPNPKHPDILGVDAIERLRVSARDGSEVGGPGRAKLWARKFDLERSGDLLDRIDSELLGTPPR